MTSEIRIGIDIGGTFTDFVIYEPGAGELRTFKLLSTPSNPAQAVITGLRMARVSQEQHLHIVHGSTVATNALLERKGARTALISTLGFRDVLQIGRQNRPSLYDFNADPADPLVPEQLRLEVKERVDHTGRVLQPLDPSWYEEILSDLRSKNVESVAVSLLFSFLHPQHEQTIGQVLREAGFPVSVSAEILPEYREYERTSTTTVNAYVSPILDRYLAELERELDSDNSKRSRMRVMQSNGGHISIGEARRNGVRCILSGPAGGVVGAMTVARLAFNLAEGEQTSPGQAADVKILTFDMGGTSTDVSLVQGTAQVTTDSEVSGCPIRIPVLDIHTIGAGGGSIASIDLGGALRVGPQSSGADPGPACYGNGILATVTDANLLLGRLAPDLFLGGQMPLFPERSRQALVNLGNDLGLNPVEAALGVIEIVNAHMERALRVISVERGFDPRDFNLLSFGGAGGLHAVELARRLEIPHVLIPPTASTLSAFGMLAADVVKDYTQTVMLPGDTPIHEISAALDPLANRGFTEIQYEGVFPDDIRLEKFLDMRYTGQSYELTVPWLLSGEGANHDFHEIHRTTYGYANPEAPLEIVNVRVRASGKGKTPPIPAAPFGDADPGIALWEYRPVVLPGSGAMDQVFFSDIPFYRYEYLHPGMIIPGPAIVIRSDTTILIGVHDEALVDSLLNLVITITPSEERQ
jgi:N-methylhydantoinase A